MPGHRAVGQRRSRRAQTWRADQNGVLGRRTGRIRAGRHRPADLVVANKSTPTSLTCSDSRGHCRLLADDGWLSIEVHHALNLVSLGQFDTIYHEHFQYYTVLSAMRALATANLAVVDVELISTHGGSIRVWARPEETAGTPSPRVAEVLRIEEAAGLFQVDGYLQLPKRTEAVRHELLRFLLDCRTKGKQVVGYGAPGRPTPFSTTAVSVAIYSVHRRP